MTERYPHINETHYEHFVKNRAIIRDYRNGITTCYLINNKGELIHKFDPEVWCMGIEDDNVIVAMDELNDKFNGEALFDLNGKQLTEFKYHSIFGGVEEGFFEVRDLEGKHGHISLSGEEVIPCIYDDGHYFEEGVATEQLNDKWGMVNWKNETVIPFEYEDIGVCNNNRISAKINGKWGVIDKFNTKLIDFKYDEIYIYLTRDCGSIPAKINDKWGIIDIYGDTLFNFVYDDCDNLDEKGWYKFKQNDKWAIYSCERNEFISNFIYEDIEWYSDGICLVKLNGKPDYVDIDNVSVSDFYYDDVKHFYQTNLIAIYKNGKCGLMNKGGKILIPPNIEGKIDHASENMLVIRDKNYKEYVMDVEGKIIIPKKEGLWFYGGYSGGYISSNMGYYDKDGKLLELKFNFENDL